MIVPIDQAQIKSILKKRKKDSHKGNYGHALIVAGSKGMMGASIICVKACLRSGAGLATANIPDTERIIVQTAVPEAMVQSREQNAINFSTFNAIGIGPGLGLQNGTEKLVYKILIGYKQPIVIDADALNCIAKNKKWLKQLPAQSILTPHAREFDRIFGEHTDISSRTATAKKIAKETGLILILKHFKTIIVSEKAVHQNTSGNAGLAKGGSGDALTGILTALLAQGYTALDAAKAGVYIHGLAADLALKEQSTESMLATDLISNLGEAFKKIQK